jgi:hypothetical protein
MATLAVCVVLLAYSVPRACAGSAHAAEIPHKFHSIEDAVNREVSTNQANEVHREQMNEYRKRQEAAVLYFKRWNLWNDRTDAWLDDQAPLNETPRQRSSRREAQKKARTERDNHRRAKDMTDTLGFAKEGGEVAVQESADPLRPIPSATPGRTGRFSESNEQAASFLASSVTSVSESYVLTEKEAEEELSQVRCLLFTGYTLFSRSACLTDMAFVGYVPPVRVRACTYVLLYFFMPRVEHLFTTCLCMNDANVQKGFD